MIGRRIAASLDALRRARGDEWRIVATRLIAGLADETAALVWAVRLLALWAAVTAAPAAYGLWSIMGGR